VEEKYLSESELKPSNKKEEKKSELSSDIAKEVSRAKPGKKTNKKMKALKKAKTKSKKSVKKVALVNNAAEVVGTDVIETPLNFNTLQKRIDDIRQVIETEEPPLKIISNNISNPNQNTIVSSDRFFHNTQKTNFYIIISILSIIIFLAAGYVYPATEDDIINGKVIWKYNNEKFDGGLFNQLYASIAFTLGVFLMGYYVNNTFIRFNVRKWNYFALGILLIFFFGLGKIGELIFNHEIFYIFKTIILPLALTVLAFASYKMYKDLNGVI
jgi:hypothetical protein